MSVCGKCLATEYVSAFLPVWRCSFAFVFLNEKSPADPSMYNFYTTTKKERNTIDFDSVTKRKEGGEKVLDGVLVCAR